MSLWFCTLFLIEVLSQGVIYIQDLCRIILLTRSMESKYSRLFSAVYQSFCCYPIYLISFLRSVLNKLTMFLYYTNDTSCISFLSISLNNALTKCKTANFFGAMYLSRVITVQLFTRSVGTWCKLFIGMKFIH